MTKFEELVQESKTAERDSLKFELYARMRDELAKQFIKLDETIYGGFVFTWSTIGKYRRSNYRRQALTAMIFMGFPEPEGFNEWEKNND